MNKIRKSIVSLLIVIAVMLTLNLVLVMGSRTANAEAAVAGEGDPYIVKLLPKSGQNYYRVWSDGRADVMQRDDFSCEFLVDAVVGSVEHPFPVVEAVEGTNHNTLSLMITYEDGRVDLVFIGAGLDRCTIAGIGTPSLCTADTDRDGDVDAADLLTLLAQWGSCQ